MCDYITTDSSLSVVGGTSGCAFNVTTYTACVGVNNVQWLTMVEHVSAGHVYSLNGSANTTTTAC